MKPTSRFFARFTRAEGGATAMEYAMIAALVGTVIVTGAGALGKAMGTQYSNVATTFANTVGE
jgi:pilus assembly protein Flp/PilA